MKLFRKIVLYIAVAILFLFIGMLGGFYYAMNQFYENITENDQRTAACLIHLAEETDLIERNSTLSDILRRMFSSSDEEND